MVSEPLPVVRLGVVGSEQLPAFVQLLEEAGAWLWARGIHQWEPGSLEPQTAGLRRAMERGCLLGATQQGGLIGGCVLTPDPLEIWRHRPGKATYLQKLVVARSVAGQGLGFALLDEAARRSRAVGSAWLRFDCWDGNEALKAYYERWGCDSLGTAEEQGYRVRLLERRL